jgi:hypothetical protein
MCGRPLEVIDELMTVPAGQAIISTDPEKAPRIQHDAVDVIVR